ncbi:MAG: hypothetical protein INF90_12145 [Roseomonas sp.]|nr:hypothetical protein [Roseomonas sp.]
MDEEQKMFTSQKYSVPAARSIALIGGAFIKTSSIITNKSLLRPTIGLPTIAAGAETVP